jgi:hypothetical protein
MALDFTLQLIFMKLPVVKEYHMRSLLKIVLPFPNAYYVCHAGFLSFTSNKTTQCSRFETEKSWGSHFPTLGHPLRGLKKGNIMPLSLLIFSYEKYTYFQKYYLY